MNIIKKITKEMSQKLLSHLCSTSYTAFRYPGVYLSKHSHLSEDTSVPDLGNLFDPSKFKLHQLKKNISRSFANKGKDDQQLQSEDTSAKIQKDLERKTPLKVTSVETAIKSQNEPKASEKTYQQDHKLDIDLIPPVTVEQEGNFSNLRKSPYYIDKTGLIAEIFKLDKENCHLICGPRRWGKSINIGMTRDFLAINQTEPCRTVDPSKNKKRKLFENTLITKNEEAMQHFGVYPVIYLDLSNATASNYEEAREELIAAIEKIQSNYQYLLQDNTIQPLLRKYLLERSSIENSPRNYLDTLCKMLSKYYQKKCVILIDEFDAPLKEILQTYEDIKDKKKVFDLYKRFFSTLLKSNENRSWGILTGVSRLASANIFSDWNNFTEHRLLEGEYVDFYSFKEDDVKELINRFEYTKKIPDLLDRLTKRYNGYTIKGQKMYNCYSVMNAFKAMKSRIEDLENYYPEIGASKTEEPKKDNLEKTEPVIDASEVEEKEGKKQLEIEAMWNDILKMYWYNTGSNEYIKKILTPLSFYMVLKMLLDEKDVYCKLGSISSAQPKMERLRDFYESIAHENHLDSSEIHAQLEDVLISFMVISGYLTFVKIKKDYYKISIPNGELREALQSLSDELLNDIYKSDFRIFSYASKMMKELLTVTKKEELYEKIKHCLIVLCHIVSLKKRADEEGRSQLKEGLYLNESAFQSFLGWAVPKTDDNFYASELNLSNRARPDVTFASRESDRIVIIELKINGNVEQAFEQTKKYYEPMYKKLNYGKQVLRLGVNYVVDKDMKNPKKDKIEFMFELFECDNGKVIKTKFENQKGSVSAEDITSIKEDFESK